MLRGKSARTRTFISYSHKDKKYLQELQIHLNNYSRLDRIDVWDDTKISAGLRWHEEIQHALQCTKVAVFLVSADFLASDFIVNHELSPLLKIAEQEDVTILPVILRTCAAFDHSELAQFKTIHPHTQPLALMEPAKRDRIWSSLAKRIWEILKSVTPQQSTLDTVLGEMGKTIVTSTRLEQLQLILPVGNWPVQFLKRAYRVSNPSGRSSLLSITGHADPLPLMLEDLATLPAQSDGTVPLLVFSCCLQAYAQQQEQKELQTALSQWIHESTEECQLDAYQVASLKRRASELQLRTSYYLLILLDAEGKNLFWVRAWLIDSNNTVLPVGKAPVFFHFTPQGLSLASAKTFFPLGSSIMGMTPLDDVCTNLF